MSRVEKIEGLALRCDVCRRTEDQDGDIVALNVEQDRLIDLFKEQAERLGWQVITRCRHCKEPT